VIAQFYSYLTYAAWPILKIMPRLRAMRGKEIPSRIQERYGQTDIPRPQGKRLVWIHAASNGEALSALSLINYFKAQETPPHIIMTTMTVTAADLLKKRVEPDGFTHQFIPYDHPQWVKRFHDYWRPDMAIWVESELWPHHLQELHQRNIPAILVNARLSNRSVRRWRLAASFFQDMMRAFDTILAQTQRDQDNLLSLGLKNVQCLGNLKDYAPALPYDPHAAEDIRHGVTSRPVILFASTHDPEEDIAKDLHHELRKDFPNLLSIIIPRHPKRGEEIAQNLHNSDLNVARRSLKMSPRADTDIYLADTLGEMGLFCHLCPIVFIGNSMGTRPGGGHNLLEPAWHHCAIVTGDDLHNFSVQAHDMPKAEACLIVKNRDELHKIVQSLLQEQDTRDALAQNAYAYVTAKYEQGMKDILTALQPTCQKAGIL